MMNTPRPKKKRPTSGTSGALPDTIGTADLPGLSVPVVFAPVAGQSVLTGDVTADLVTLFQGGVLRATATGVTRLAGNTFAFTFGSLAALTTGSVEIRLASWHDSVNNSAAAVFASSISPRRAFTAADCSSRTDK